MSGHVVRPFIVMGIGPRILWCEPRKIGEDVGLHLGRGILWMISEAEVWRQNRVSNPSCIARR